MKSKTDCFLSYFLGQLRYILRIYIKPLTEVTNLSPSQGEVMSRLVFQRLRKDSMCCLLGDYHQEFSLFWKQGAPIGSPVGWNLPDLLWRACLEHLAEEQSYSCTLDQRSILLHREDQILPLRVQFWVGHLWSSKEKGNSYLDSQSVDLILVMMEWQMSCQIVQFTSLICLVKVITLPPLIPNSCQLWNT